MNRFCSGCGNKLENNEKFCRVCGTNNIIIQGMNVNVQQSKYNGQAIASFVISIAGLFIFAFIFGSFAISFGITALNHIKLTSNEKGRGLAIAGIIIGIVDIVSVIFLSIVQVLV